MKKQRGLKIIIFWLKRWPNPLPFFQKRGRFGIFQYLPYCPFWEQTGVIIILRACDYHDEKTERIENYYFLAKTMEFLYICPHILFGKQMGFNLKLRAIWDYYNEKNVEDGKLAVTPILGTNRDQYNSEGIFGLV